jgi:hypothetical protein
MPLEALVHLAENAGEYIELAGDVVDLYEGYQYWFGASGASLNPEREADKMARKQRKRLQGKRRPNSRRYRGTKPWQKYGRRGGWSGPPRALREMKYLDLTRSINFIQHAQNNTQWIATNETATSAGTEKTLFQGLDIGSGVNKRLGNAVYLHSIVISATFVYQAEGHNTSGQHSNMAKFCLALVEDRACSNADMALSEIWAASAIKGSACNALRVIEHTDQYKVLKKWRTGVHSEITGTATGGSYEMARRQFVYEFKTPKLIKFDGVTGEVSTLNKINMQLMGTVDVDCSAANSNLPRVAEILTRTRLRFTDAS